MGIFLLLSIFIFAILFIGKNFIYSAKRNLFKDQTAWSAKDITIKYQNSKEIERSQGNDNFLKRIADESKVFLENEYEEE
tara:strand:- start:79 stop:318 length:240 start_codon:yes stop_codon:yes gene_type:complete